jgi:hypothetical protein
VAEKAHCRNCKHWNKEEGMTRELGLCKRVHPFWDRSEWRDMPDGDYCRVLSENAKDDMMFVQDGSDYVAYLYTKPEFFCAHHEK